MTAFPSHPWCWNFVSVESNEGRGRYRLRRGVLSLAGAWLPPAQCPAALTGPPVRPGPPDLSLLAEAQGSLAELRKLRSDDCYFEAWLRFARTPYVGPGEASDLRFVSAFRRNFTTIRLDRSGRRTCPRHVPGWDFPRADLLAPQPAPK